jgi:acetylornithine deacetylase/succinyl-diaminopimelate desuccinylase-like protein
LREPPRRRSPETGGTTTPPSIRGVADDPADDLSNEVTELLCQLIRNGCVNDGDVASGQERRSADVLAGYLEGPGLDLQRYEPAPGRSSVVARIEGSDPTTPSLMLMGHTDVVPANPARWTRDPFGGEVIDGEVWGRGAIDMLNLTASMAVAFRTLARNGFRPRGSLVYLAVADEEALGAWGADWLCRHERPAIDVDYVLTEGGGAPVPTPTGPRVPTSTGEKGSYWVHLDVAGTAGHGSRPYRTDNALVTAAEVVRRLAGYRPAARVHEAWRAYVAGVGWDPEVAAALVDPDRVDGALDSLPLGLARFAHACTHTTFAPTVISGGVKTNVIPDHVRLDVDIRTLPGQRGADVRAMLAEALGDLAARVTVELIADDEPSDSPLDTPLWEALSAATAATMDGAGLLPVVSAGASDARFFRRLGIPSYGVGLLSRSVSPDRYVEMFHGDDERVDVASLGATATLWQRVAVAVVGR